MDWRELLHNLWKQAHDSSDDLNLALALFGGIVGLLTVISLAFNVFHFLANRKLNRKLKTIEDRLSGEWDDLWLLHDPGPYTPGRSVSDRLLRRKPEAAAIGQKRVCIFNQKGGVGKTTLAINLAAYFDQHAKKTLLIDLDYQGSLSDAMLSAIEHDEVDSNVDKLFSEPEPTEREIKDLEKSLNPKLPNTRIITSFLSFGRIENRLMMNWLIDDSCTDIRHVLARALPKMREFEVIIFDCPPRLTTGTINALCAATHVLIPTVLNPMSARSVAPTLGNLRRLTARLNPTIRLLGVVGNLTRQSERNTKENIQFQAVSRMLRNDWSDPQTEMFDRTLPRKEAVGQGDSIAYLGTDKASIEFRNLFDQLGDKIATRLWSEDKPDENIMLEAAE
jgi:cellulose biosynthesis protein BcsQ